MPRSARVSAGICLGVELGEEVRDAAASAEAVLGALGGGEQRQHGVEVGVGASAAVAAAQRGLLEPLRPAGAAAAVRPDQTAHSTSSALPRRAITSRAACSSRAMRTTAVGACRARASRPDDVCGTGSDGGRGRRRGRRAAHGPACCRRGRARVGSASRSRRRSARPRRRRSAGSASPSGESSSVVHGVVVDAGGSEASRLPEVDGDPQQREQRRDAPARRAAGARRRRPRPGRRRRQGAAQRRDRPAAAADEHGHVRTTARPRSRWARRSRSATCAASAVLGVEGDARRASPSPYAGASQTGLRCASHDVARAAVRGSVLRSTRPAASRSDRAEAAGAAQDDDRRRPAVGRRGRRRGSRGCRRCRRRGTRRCSGRGRRRRRTTWSGATKPCSSRTCAGSVSWNSSTRTTGYRARSARLHVRVVREQRGPVDDLGVVGDALGVEHVEVLAEELPDGPPGRPDGRPRGRPAPRGPRVEAEGARLGRRRRAPRRRGRGCRGPPRARRARRAGRRDTAPVSSSRSRGSCSGPDSSRSGSAKASGSAATAAPGRRRTSGTS